MSVKKNKIEPIKFSKKSIGEREHLTLKNDTLEADIYRQEQEKESNKKRQVKEKKLPLGIQKMRKKVREVYDEEDEEDYLEHVYQPKEDDDILLNALSDEEKKNLKQRNVVDTIKKQQDAGKMEALHIAQNFALESGMKGLDATLVAEKMQEATPDFNQTKSQAIEKGVTKKLGVKGKIQDRDIIQAARGIKKVENFAGIKATKNLETSDVVKIGKNKLDDIKLAELILQKSGQELKKRKENFNKSKDNVDLKYLKQNSQDSNLQKNDSKNEHSETLLKNKKNDDFSR